MTFFRKQESIVETPAPTLEERFQEAAHEVERCEAKIKNISEPRFAFIRKHSVKTNRHQQILSAVVKNVGEMEPLLKEWAALNQELADAILASRAALSIWAGLKAAIEKEEQTCQ